MNHPEHNLKHQSKYLGIGWQLSELHGWGVFGINLARSLIKRQKPLFKILDQPVLDGPAAQELAPYLQSWHSLAHLRAQLPAQPPLLLEDTVIVHGFGNNFTGPGSRPRFRGFRNAGFIFFEESKFTPERLELGKSLDMLLAGSSWNKQVLQDLGFFLVDFVMQGVDTERFQPRPRRGRFPGRFVIFSGGKLELRKGQDIVVKAFRAFQQRHPEALLVTAWHNPWPSMALNIQHGPHGLGAPAIGEGGLDINGWLWCCGLPQGSFMDVGFINNRELPDWYREADLAVFPNRAEGGTNLVAMEVMACGIPCILSANTGHLDIIDNAHCYALQTQKPMVGEEHVGWGESAPEELLELMEQAYTKRAEAQEKGVAGAAFIRQMTWPHQTGKLIASLAAGLGINFNGHESYII